MPGTQQILKKRYLLLPQKTVAVITPAGFLEQPFTLPQARTRSHLHMLPCILCPRHLSCLTPGPALPSIHLLLSGICCVPDLQVGTRDPEANQTWALPQRGPVKCVIGQTRTQNPSRE